METITSVLYTVTTLTSDLSEAVMLHPTTVGGNPDLVHWLL